MSCYKFPFRDQDSEFDKKIVLITETNVTKGTRKELPFHPSPHPWAATHRNGLVFRLFLQQIFGCELFLQLIACVCLGSREVPC